MAAVRDPLSVRYDGAARNAVTRAIRRGEGRAVRVWVASPRGEFRARDPGGRTAHERAFTRSVYYLVFRVPLNRGVPPEWSVKLEWGGDGERRDSSQGRLARPVLVRVYPRSKARVRGPKWTDDPARQSKMGEGGVRVIPGG